MQNEQETLHVIRARCAHDALLLQRVSLVLRTLSEAIDTERYTETHGPLLLCDEPVLATVVVVDSERRRHQRSADSRRHQKCERVDTTPEQEEKEEEEKTPERPSGGGRPRRQYAGFRWHGLKARHAQYCCERCATIVGARGVARHECTNK